MQLSDWNGLSADERDSFVNSLVEYGTDFVAPLYSVVEKIEETLQEKNSTVRAQADARPVLWWNGIRKGEAGDFVGPSFSEKEDTNHDIPLVSAVNPCNIAPVDMVLHCPNCGLQHIDHPEPAVEHEHGAVEFGAWDNPPHRSHLCHGCGHIWRPADVPTNGVLAIKTKGQNDSPITGPDRVDDTHPEASAPGLSDDVSSVRAALIGLANHVRAVPAYSKLLGDMEQVDKAIAILTRASAATVAEPTVVRGVRVCSISDIECTKQCGAICHHEATQQQAEPGADERVALHVGDKDGKPLFVFGSAGATAIAQEALYRATQSGQRAGVAECKWSPDSDFEGDTWDSACGEKWCFIDGGPVENRVRFCQGCGGRVVLAAAPEAK